MRKSKSSSLRSVAAVAVVAIFPPETLEHRRARRLRAFTTGIRPVIAGLTSASPRIEDLADSFPALLYALATGYGSDQARRATILAIQTGRPLKEAAQQLGLPFWMRKLPPHAFQAPIQNPPTDPDFATRLMALIPAQANAIAPWLDRVMTAHHTGRPDLALWVAQTYRGATPSATSRQFLRLLAWGWHTNARSARAGQLLTTRWDKSIGLRRAASEATLWQERIALDICLGEGLRDAWLEEGMHGGLEFTALKTADDFIAEAKVMDNCLDRFADRLEGRTVRIFSIRRDGRSLANLEITPHEREPGLPSIAQMRGPRNRPAPMDVWQAAYAWLGGQTIKAAEPHMQIKPRPAARLQRAELIWRPFLDALPETARTAFAAVAMPARRRKR